MAQHDYNIANQGFPAFRTDLNNALSAIQTTNSGTSRPTGAVAGQLWLDTTTATSPTLKYYDGADDISLATIDHTANTVNWLDSTVSVTGLTTTATGTVLTLSDSANTSTVNLIIDNDKEIRFREATANGTNYISLSAPASLSADVTYTLPVAPTANNQALISSTAGAMSFTPYSLPASDGTANQILQTNGSGVVSFATPSGGGFSGATENAVSSSPLTLTNTSTQYHKVQISSLANSYVTLPDATTMTTEGTPVFVIFNASAIGAGLDIRNNGGTTVGTITASNTAFVSLVNNSTANGIWQVNTVVDQAILDISSTVNSYTPTNSTCLKVVHLTATKLLVVNFFKTSDTVLTGYFRIGDYSGDTITFGTQQTTTITAGGSDSGQYRADVFRLSDSTFILFWGNASNTGGIRRVSANTVSGTTITFGTQNALSFPSGGTDNLQARATALNGMACRMADDKFAVVYNTTVVSGASYWEVAYSGSLTCNIITVSGTTLTVGTKVDLGSSTFTNANSLVCHDTDRLCCVYYQATSASNATGRTKVNIISVSGTTPTWGTSVNVEASDIPFVTQTLHYWDAPHINNTCSLNNIFGVALSTTSVVGIGGGVEGSQTGYILISISGTTPTIVATKAVQYAQLYNSILHINSTTLFIPHSLGTGGRYLYVTSSGFRLSAYTSFTANSAGTSALGSATIRGTSASTNLTIYPINSAINYIIKGTFVV